jgi:hypothetical protein
MIVVSLDMAYRLYGTISVKRYSFSISCSYGRVLFALVLIVRPEPDDGLQPSGSWKQHGPRGARHSAQSSRRTLVFGRSYRDQNHDAVIRIGGEAPRRRAHSPYGADTMRYGGWPPPRIVLKPCYVCCIRLHCLVCSSRCSRYRQAQRNTFGDLAGRHHAPQRDE